MSARRRPFAVALLVAASLGLSGLIAPAALAVAPTSAPVTVSPTPFANDVPRSPVFSWQKLAGATKYRFQVATSDTFTAPRYDVTTYGLHATPTTPLPVGELFWRVAAQDAASAQGPWSDVVPFTVTADDTPTLVAPADGTTLSYPSEPPVLKWLPVPGAKSYTVEVDDVDTFPSPVTYSTVNSQYALTEPPLHATPQYWRVKATLSASPLVTTSFSPPWTFTANWPAAPTLSWPVNGASVSELRLAWGALPGAKTYEVQISPNGDFQNNLVSTATVMSTQFAPVNELPPQSYYWRVRAKDAAASTHNGPWSAESTFTLRVIPAPTNLRPGADPANTPPLISEPTFSWDGVERAAYYELQIGTDQNFTNTSAFTTCRTYHTTWTAFLSGPRYPCPLHFGGSRYFWRVRAVSSNPFYGDWSTPKSFFFGYEGTPSVLAPADGATVQTPALSWAPVLGFNKYRLRYKKTTSAAWTTKDVYSTSFTLPVDPAATADTGSYVWSVRTLDTDNVEGLGLLNPPGFTLEAPTGGDTLEAVAPSGASSPNMPAMSWTALTDAKSYTVHYRQVGAPGFITLKAGLKTTSYTSPDEPLGAGNYEWFVQALDANAGHLGYSDTETFTIADPARVTYTGPPTCINNPCTSNADTPTLSWQPVHHAYKYIVHTATDPNFANPLPTHVTQHPRITFPEHLVDNQAGQSYYWYVQVCKSPSVCGPFQDGNLAAYEQSFRKATPPVSLLSPAPGATVGDDPHLSWHPYFVTSPDASPARRYRLKVSQSSDLTTPVEDVVLDQTTYTPFLKEYADGVYYWQVQAIDGEGNALTASAVRSFTKSSLTPTLETVGSTTPLPTLSWSPLAYVGSYKVEVYPGETTNVAPALTASTKLPAYTPIAALAKGTYTWRVAKLDPSGNRGPWSPTSTFQVASPAASLLAPEDGAGLSSDDLLFSWTRPSESVVNYKLETSTSSAFATVFESVVTAGQAWASPKKYADGVKHYWRVSALDAANNVLATSGTFTFTKDAASPTVTTVTPALDLPLTGTSATVTFSEAVTNVTSTTLTVYPKGSPGLVVPGKVTVSLDKRSATFAPSSPLMPGRVYTVSASHGITDLVGNPLVPHAQDRRAARTVDSSHPVVRELWDSDASGSASGGAFATSRLAGTTLTYSFTGTSFSLLGTRGPLGGYANVSVDGAAPVKVSFYRSATAYKQVVLSRSGLAAKPHTVKVTVLGGTPPAGSKGTYAYVDALVTGATTLQESSARHTFVRVGAGAAFGGSYQRELLDPAGDTGGKPEYRMTFYGTGVDLHAVRTAASGKVRVYVDGGYRDVDTYNGSTVYDSRVYSSASVPAGQHTLRVVFLGAKSASASGYAVLLDRIVVR